MGLIKHCRMTIQVKEEKRRPYRASYPYAIPFIKVTNERSTIQLAVHAPLQSSPIRLRVSCLSSTMPDRPQENSQLGVLVQHLKHHLFILYIVSSPPRAPRRRRRRKMCLAGDPTLLHNIQRIKTDNLGNVRPKMRLRVSSLT